MGKALQRTCGPLLEVRISVDYPGRPDALAGIDFEIAPGEALGLAGESGSGKSTIALAILRLLEYRGGRTRGAIRLDGVDLLRLKESAMRDIRGRRIALVLQSPVTALNPALRLETQLKEAWRAHSCVPWREARPGVQRLLERMGLSADESFLRRYPAQVSIGQAQRVVIAMAVLHKPALVIADEPTSALDQTTSGEILELFRSLRQEYGTALLFISHDRASMHALCDRVLTIAAGRLIPGVPVPFEPSRPVPEPALAQ